LIDLHCHILPGLDDGARDIEDSLAMAQQAKEDGIAVVCSTPHIRHDHDLQIEELASRVAALQEELARREIGVRIAPGGELAETEADRLTDAQLRLVSFGAAGGWLLLEPAPGPLGEALEGLVERLAARGFATIIAHPERHAGADFEQRLASLVRLGCLIQWTAEFLAAAAAGDLALRLAARGLVHLLGSDAHSSHVGRPVRLAAGFARLASVCTPARMAWMIDDAPRAILRGEPVSPAP
jgi:protein-tyrosine phosphatase